MPAKSKAQFRFMQAVASGKVKKKGLSREEAREYVSGQSPKDLPEVSAIKHQMGKKKRRR